MPLTPWKPWHQVVTLRNDLKTGELSLSMFAADLYDVAMNKGNKIYRDPHEFFSFTYPTYNIRQLAKDVAHRLDGRNDKAIRQLELTYGGGKTHTLITLYQLFHNPDKLPNLPAVKEFIEDIGFQPPKARIVVLSFDKIDVEKGTETISPTGEKRWLRNPWSILAYQIAGSEGLRLLHSQEKDEERETAPAENLLSNLLAIPESQGLATLILIDEVLMYARAKVGFDPSWMDKLKDFFQYLTQAATDARRCAIVVSLLATDPRKSDDLGKQITRELSAVFRREKDENIQPVEKEDVAEVLCRRFFTHESIRNRESFRPHVVAALKGIFDLDDQSKKDGKAAEERYLKSYPFHPDLIDVFYSKWTQLEGFQRTRGVLRTYALALREAETWDKCPLIGSNVFLMPPGKNGISISARELTSIAASEEYQGKKQEWSGILETELAKAQDIQNGFTGLKYREVEQSVFATFLHSQPIGQKAQTRELFLLVGPTRPDKIELIKSLASWTEISWFLDEETMTDRDPQTADLPKAWRLGSRPNLRQMFSAANGRIPKENIEIKLIDEIGKLRTLTSGIPAGIKTHNLPERPQDISDDSDFHYAVLGPKTVSEPGKPSSEAKRFIEETTSPERPRIYRNAIVLAVPLKDGLEAAKDRIRDYLAWEEVKMQLEKQGIDQIRLEVLKSNIDASKKKIPESIQQAYCLAITVSEKNEIEAYRITVNPDPLFTQIKNKKEIRIQETLLNPEALLPSGPYDLWKGDQSLPAKNIVTSFAQFTHLPKMINRRGILETLVKGMKDGSLVLKITRPDKTTRTFWREDMEETMRSDATLEAILPQYAEINNIQFLHLKQGILPSLWKGPEITVKNARDYFSGTTKAVISREGYEEQLYIPKATSQALEDAIKMAVKLNIIWLTSGPATLLGEDLPEGMLTDDATMRSPPESIPPTEILPTNLPDAWTNEKATALTISIALSKKKKLNFPWIIVKNAINSARAARYIEITKGQWPCEYSSAKDTQIELPKTIPPIPPPFTPPSNKYFAEADLQPSQIQDLSDKIGEIQTLTAGLDLKFRIQIEIQKDTSKPNKLEQLNKALKGIDEKLELK